MDPVKIYQELQSLLQQQLSPITYNGWFPEMKAVDILTTSNGHILVLSTPNTLAEKIVPERFTSTIQNCFQLLNYPDFSFQIITGQAQAASSQTFSNTVSLLERQKKANLIPRYTFDTFVEGSHNKLAYHSSLAVSESPGKNNPLFIWGKSGLGKTHLLHAIGNHLLELEPEKNVLYVPSETFMNELINSISSKRTESFREKYRKIDLLLLDDVQFIEGKESTQIEFFHTFNDLYNANKQIVLCSDRPPEEIENLTDRIRSRFKWGLIVDIQSPDYETRIAILKKKVDQSEMHIEMDVLSFIAGHVDSNVRELEGALNRVEAYSQLLSPNTQITKEIAGQALKDYSNADSAKVISSSRVVEAVAEYYNVTVDDLCSKSKQADIVFPRQVAMYLCRKLTNDKLKIIGKALGGRDHSTVVYGADQISAELTNMNNLELPQALNDIEKRINGEK